MNENSHSNLNGAKLDNLAAQISGGIIVQSRKELDDPEHPRVTKSRISSLDKNVYRQLRQNPSPSQNLTSNTKFSRRKILGKSCDKIPYKKQVGT